MAMNDESSKGDGAPAPGGSAGAAGAAGAAGPGSLIALKDRRTEVIAALSHAFARDDLEVEELDRRLELVHRAGSVAELDALVADVAPATLVPAARAVSLRRTANVSVALDRPERQALVAIMGGVERSGRWTVPAKLSAHCLMGGISLDFREADLGPGVTELSILCMMGGVEIIVPPHVSVQLAGSAILGGFDQSHPGADALDTEPVATLRITGVAFAGGVGVETRRVGESARQARKRIKGERKLLGEGKRPTAGQAALPAAIVVPERKPKR